MSLLRIATSLPRLRVHHLSSLHPQLRQICTTPSSTPPGPSSPPTPSDKPDELTLLHDAILLQIPTHGFTLPAIEAAIKELGWSPAARAMLPRGPIQVVEEFSRRCDVALAKQLGEENSDSSDSAQPSISKAAFAIKTRLDMVEPFHDHWPTALKLRALPQNSARALKDSATLADEIAHYAGFTRPDASWYTDRAVLGFSYHATELYWLTDKSEGREETWHFLDRRLRDSYQLRTSVTSAYNNLMTLSDATLGSLATLVRSARRSY